MNYINYKTLYLDFLKDSSHISQELKGRLILKLVKEKDECIPFKKIAEFNELISHDLSIEGDLWRTQNLKSYDSDYIKYILNYQKENGLTNIEIASEFKLSKNTIMKWNKIKF